MKTPAALTNLDAQIAVLNEQWALFTEMELEQRPAPRRWSKKETLGHLVDSAANNHRRFVLAQTVPGAPLPLIPYDQDAWVQTGHYVLLPAAELLHLWTAYNRFLRHMLAAVPEYVLARQCFIFNNTPVTLDWLIDDYVLHLEHHVQQIIHEHD